MTKHCLATVYLLRIRGEKADNLEIAIYTYQLVLDFYNRETFPEKWATTQNDLGVAYERRIRGEKIDNIEQAILAYNLALEIRTFEVFPVQWAATQNNLATAYVSRIEGEQQANLEQAFKIYKLTEKVYTREAFPVDWAMSQNNLSLACFNGINGENDNIEQAIDACKRALKVLKRETSGELLAMINNNLANGYKWRIQGERIYNLEQAVSAYKIALEVYSCEGLLHDVRGVAGNLGNLHFEQKAWLKAASTYATALSTAETLYQSSISYAGKGDELKATADIPHPLAYAQAKLGNVQDAVFTLEQSRARGLSQSLNRDRANLNQLQTLTPHLYTEYKNITEQLRNLESRDRDRMVSTDRDRIPESLITTTTKLRKEIQETIAQIRQVPTYEDFLTPTKWEDIEIALRSDNPLIYIVTTPNGSVTIVVTPEKIEAIWSDFTETQLSELVQKWFDFYNNSQTDRTSWLNTIDTTTRQLWDLLMGPIVQQLKTMGIDRATLIPTGYLSLLPLHAAWTPDPDRPTGKRYAIDDIHFTYTPNARSLTEARKIADRQSPPRSPQLATGNRLRDRQLQRSDCSQT
jgi:tetratricopeptide (TPR) repeat protein